MIVYNMERQYTAVIQAGGKGTRVRELTQDRIPKPLLNIDNKPIIQWQIEELIAFGIKEFIVIVGHLGHMIEQYLGDGSEFGIDIRYVYESKPLGSAGAFLMLKDMLKTSDFVFAFADVFFSINWSRFIEFHEKKEGLITLFAHPNSHPDDSDLLIVDKDTGLVEYIHYKDEIWNDSCRNIVNSGISICSRDIIDCMDNQLNKLDYEKDIVSNYICMKKVYAYISSEFVKDMGTVQRFQEVTNAVHKQLPQKRNLIEKQKAIFADRDGTINVLDGLIKEADEIRLEINVAEAIKLVNNSEYLFIVITNQPVVARGLCSLEEVDAIHGRMEKLLGEKGAYVDDLIFCPHHPDKGYPEENPKYKVKCNCRKPAIGMINQMVDKYNIDLSKSWMIGDSTTDIMTARNAGIKSVLVQTGEAGQDGKYEVEPDYIKKNLLEAVKCVLGKD